MYNLTHMMVPESTRVEGAGAAATLLEAVEGESTGPPRVENATAAEEVRVALEAAKEALNDANAATRRIHEERKLAERLWEQVVSGAVGAARGTNAAGGDGSSNGARRGGSRDDEEGGGSAEKRSD